MSHRDVKPENLIVDEVPDGTSDCVAVSAARPDTDVGLPTFDGGAGGGAPCRLVVRLIDFGVAAWWGPAAAAEVVAAPGVRVAHGEAAAVASRAPAEGAGPPGRAGTARDAPAERRGAPLYMCSDVCGSAGFIAPEVLLAPQYDVRRVDAWSLACVPRGPNSYTAS